ncbi:MAG: DNA double-strand break repair nuclease NurA [Candidatus Caldarchaeum sp.]|nr:DNA double-strand break repair nuclease NurA [Candidatus Caldarchaeum sp.]
MVCGVVVAYVADLFVSWLKDNAERMRDDFTGGRGLLLQELVDGARRMWVSFDKMRYTEFERVAAVDGGLLVFASAYAVGPQIDVRDFECAVAYPPDKKYATLLMKTLELRVAVKAVEQLPEGSVLLLDGSLFGLLSKPLITPSRSPRDYGKRLLRFLTELEKLVSEATARKVMLISVAKVSSSTSLRDYLLSLVHRSEVIKLKAMGYLEPEDMQAVESVLSAAFRNPVKALKTMRNMKAKYGSLLDKIESLVEQVSANTTDMLILSRCCGDTGFSRPLVIGASSRLRDQHSHALQNVEEYVERKLLLSGDAAVEMYGLLNRMRFLPAVVSTYIRFDNNDYPLKVDVAAGSLGLSQKFFEVDLAEPLKNVEEFSEVVSCLRQLYGSREVYNVWLYEADRRARLRRSDVRLLLELLEKQVGPVELSRRAWPEPPD